MFSLSSFRSASKRILTVTSLVGLISATSVGVSSAESSAIAAVPSAPSIAGMSVATFAWVLIGLVLVMVGLVAATKTGKRTARALAAQPSNSESTDTDQAERPQAALAI